MDNKFLKVISAIYLICLFLLTVLLPVGAILIIAKLTGAGLSWVGACVPLLIAAGICCPLFASKIIIDISNSEGK